MDPLEAHADHVSITALCAALKLRVRIAYLDAGVGAGSEHVTFHSFGEEPPADAGGASPARRAAEADAEAEAPLVHLLFRPGHYDVLEVV